MYRGELARLIGASKESLEGKTSLYLISLMKLCGLAEEELSNVPFLSLVAAEEQGRWEIFWNNVKAGNQPAKTDSVLVRRDTRRLEVQVILTPVLGEDDHLVAVLMFLRKSADIGEEDWERRLAWTIAHELRSPFLTLNNLAYLMEKRYEPRHVTRMKQQLALCESILNNLLEFGGTREVKPESFLIENLWEEVRSLISIPEHIQLEATVPEQMLLWGDRLQIRQVFLNLIRNAVEALGEKPGKITVHLSEQDEWSLLEILDNGCGIPEHLRDQIFRPLRSTKAQGLGLGLAICKQLVEANGGTITFESQAGYGTRFCIHIPRHGGRNMIFNHTEHKENF